MPENLVDSGDSIIVTGITEGIISSHGSTILHVFDTLIKFYVMSANLRVPDNGILGGDYFYKEEASVSYFHKAVVIKSRPISPIPFLNPLSFSEKNDSDENFKLAGFTLKARTRQVIPIKVINTDCTEGYLPPIDAGEGILLGKAAVSVNDGVCYAMAINVGYEDVKIKVSPQTSIPYEIYNDESEPDSEEQLERLIKEQSSSQISKRERVDLIYDLVGANKLPREERESVLSLIQEFPHLFLLPGDELPGTSLEQHTIPTIDDVPLNTKQYRYPPVHKEELRKQIQKLLDLNIIKESTSPYNSPLWIVPKKADANGNRKWRMVIDFRALNEKTVGDAYPLPNITEILDGLGKARYFSMFDLASGFYQIPINLVDGSKTAFSTDRGHYEFLRMPMGLKGAPASFQRLMDRVLTGLQNTELFVYLDDIVIFASNIQEHTGRVRRLFARLSAAGLRLQPEKCAFLSTKVKYLGHIISENGVSPDPAKIEAVQNFPIPKTPKNIREFLGLVGYYRRFIAEFARRTKSLSDLLKQGRKFVWGEEQQKSFDDMKDCLTRAPILQYPDFEKPFILTTDASDYAIGAVLSQGKVGHDLPIAYASRLLTKAERNYSTTERECLAVVEYARYFKHYLYGKNFIVLTDHQALRWLHSVKDPSSRLMRWRLKLRDYQYEIVYKSGKTNKNADALSRNPTSKNDDCIVREIRIFPITPMIDKRKPGRPRKESIITDSTENDESEPEESGIAARVRSRNRSRPRPNYNETWSRQRNLPPSSCTTSESETELQLKTRKAQGTIKKMSRYEIDDDYDPPRYFYNQPLSIENLFQKSASPTPSNDIIVEMDPYSIIGNSQRSRSESESGNSNEKSNATISDNQSSSLEITILENDRGSNAIPPPVFLPPEQNPSDSESEYSDALEEQTLIPTNENTIVSKPNDSFNTSNMSVLEKSTSSSQSSPIVPSSYNSQTEILCNKQSPPTHVNREKQPSILGLYETIPPDPLPQVIDSIGKIPIMLDAIIKRNISISNDSLLMARDNYAHFIASDCDLSTKIGHLLSDLGYINKFNLREQKPHKGSVIVSQYGKIKIFSLVCRERFFDQITEDDLYVSMRALKNAMLESKTKSIRIPNNDNTFEKLPEHALRNIIKRVFSESDLSITLCRGKVEIPPPDKRKEIIKEFHSSVAGGHKGFRKTYRRIRERFYWTDMVREIHDTLRSCRSCQMNKLVRIKTKQPMVLTDTPSDAFDKVCLDIVGPLPISPNGNRHILTMQCNLTKYCLAIPVPDIRATTIADAFAREFIFVFGCPRAILSDRGTSFVNRLLGKLAKLLKINQLTTSGYRPQTKGSLERSHQVLADYLKHYLKDESDWDTFLPFAMLSYNTTVHEGTKFSPFHLVFGKDARLPSSFPSIEVLETYGTYLSNLVVRLDELRSLAAKNLDTVKIRSKHYYDRKLNEKTFKSGDKVLFLREPRKHKFERYYDGSLEVVDIHNRNNVVYPDTGKRLVKHIDKIKHFYHDSSDESDY